MSSNAVKLHVQSAVDTHCSIYSPHSGLASDLYSSFGTLSSHYKMQSFRMFWNPMTWQVGIMTEGSGDLLPTRQEVVAVLTVPSANITWGVVTLSGPEGIGSESRF